MNSFMMKDATFEELKRVETLAKKLVRLGADEDKAIMFASRTHTYSVHVAVQFLKEMFKGGSVEYTQEVCANPMCFCDNGGFIEIVTDQGRSLFNIACGIPMWEKIKVERI